MATTEDLDTDGSTTEVTVRCTGHVRDVVGANELTYAFPGDTLRDFLVPFFETYPVEDLLLAATEADATAPGWAPRPADLADEGWAKNPEGEQTRTYARILVNGTFNEHLDGLDTALDDGDRVALMNPFLFCV